MHSNMFVHVKFVCTNIFRHSFVSVLENHSNIHTISHANIRSEVHSCQILMQIYIYIYSDIHSCNSFDTNILRHLFMSNFLQMSHSDSH